VPPSALQRQPRVASLPSRLLQRSCATEMERPQPKTRAANCAYRVGDATLTAKGGPLLPFAGRQLTQPTPHHGRSPVSCFQKTSRGFFPRRVMARTTTTAIWVLSGVLQSPAWHPPPRGGGKGATVQPGSQRSRSTSLSAGPPSIREALLFASTASPAAIASRLPATSRGRQG
jgi:hypothetical protein